jgi:hypothetical protein
MSPYTAGRVYSLNYSVNKQAHSKVDALFEMLLPGETFYIRTTSSMRRNTQAGTEATGVKLRPNAYENLIGAPRVEYIRPLERVCRVGLCRVRPYQWLAVSGLVDYRLYDGGILALFKFSETLGASVFRHKESRGQRESKGYYEEQWEVMPLRWKGLEYDPAWIEPEAELGVVIGWLDLQNVGPLLNRIKDIADRESTQQEQQ